MCIEHCACVCIFAARRLHLNVKRSWPPSLICNCNQECMRRCVCACVCVEPQSAKAYMVCRCQYRCPASTSALASTVPSGTWRLLRSPTSHLFVMHLCNLLWLSATCREKGMGERGGCRGEPFGLGAGSGRYIVWPRPQHARHLLNF